MRFRVCSVRSRLQESAQTEGIKPCRTRLFVVGVGMTKFEKPGRREGWDYPQMANESGTKALADAGIDYAEVRAGLRRLLLG